MKDYRFVNETCELIVSEIERLQDDIKLILFGNELYDYDEGIINDKDITDEDINEYMNDIKDLIYEIRKLNDTLKCLNELSEKVSSWSKEEW